MRPAFIKLFFLSWRLVLLLVVIGSFVYLSMFTSLTWNKPYWAYSVIFKNPSQNTLDLNDSNLTRSSVSASSDSSSKFVKNSLIRLMSSTLDFGIKKKFSNLSFDNHPEYRTTTKYSQFSFPHDRDSDNSDLNSIERKIHSPSKMYLYRVTNKGYDNKQSSYKHHKRNKIQMTDNSTDSKSQTDSANSKSQLNRGNSKIQTPSSAYKSLLTIKPRWEQLDKHNPHLFVYSAHFDDTESQPFVVSILTGPDKRKSFSVVCVYFDSPEVSEPNGMVHGWCQNYQNADHLQYGRYHGAYIKCPLPSTKTANANKHLDNHHDYNHNPYAVSVFRANTILPNAPESYLPLMTNLMAITYSGRRHSGTRLARTFWNVTKCFPAMFRYGNAQGLIEQIEIHRMFGVEHFTVYMSSASPEVHSLLRFYVEKGIVEVFNWTLPFSDFTKKAGKMFFYFDQMDAIQDCLLRHLRSSRYVLFGDLDEIAVPRSGNHLLPLFDRLLAKQPQCGAFIFRNTFYDPIYNGNDTRSKNHNYTGWKFAHQYKLRSLLLVHRVNDIWEYPKRSKPVVLPTRVNVTKVHNIGSFRGNFTECVLSPSEGLLHHYRRVPVFIGPTHQPSQAGYVFDPYLRTFSREIVRRVGAIVRAFRETNVSEDVKPEY